MNYFIHRENESKKSNRTLFSVRFDFLDSFLDEQNNLYSQSYIKGISMEIWRN